MGWFTRYSKTNFEAGGCVIEDIPMGADIVLTAQKFTAPRKIDSRDMLVTSSNQGQTPHCVGYSTAGYCEYYHWKNEHYPKQLDGDAIYAKAKKYDKSPQVKGTWPKFGVQAAVKLGLITGKGKYIPNTRNDVKFALHQYGVCIAGFMITDEWNKVAKINGIISDFGNRAVKRGGHCVLICGYDESGVYIQNSWGEGWGLHGFGMLKWKQFDRQFMNGMVIVP